MPPPGQGIPLIPLAGFCIVLVFLIVIATVSVSDFAPKHAGKPSPSAPRRAASSSSQIVCPPKNTADGAMCHLKREFPQALWQYKTAKGDPRVVAQTTTQPPFLLSLLHPKFDTVVSAAIASRGLSDFHVSSMFYKILGDRGENCRGHYGSALVVDVGSNVGQFSMLSASLGCKVLAFEVQPQLVALSETSAALNELSHKVEVVNMAVTDTEKKYIIPLNYGGNAGHMSLEGREEQGHYNSGGHLNEAVVESTRLDHVQFDRDIYLLKVDVEGTEPHVMDSASGLLEKHRVHNVLLRFTPPQAGRDNSLHTSLLHKMYDYGYHGRVLNDVGGGSFSASHNPSAMVELSRPLQRNDFHNFCEALSNHIASELINERGRQVGGVDIWFYLVHDTDLTHI